MVVDVTVWEKEIVQKQKQKKQTFRVTMATTILSVQLSTFRHLSDLPDHLRDLIPSEVKML